MKKFTTLALAGAMAAAMSCSAFADTQAALTFSNDVNKDKTEGVSLYTIDATGYEKAVITFDFTDTYGGGGMGFNTVATGDWANCNEFSNEAETMTYKINVADIKADEETGKQTFQVQCWWVGETPFTAQLTLVGGEAAPSGDVAPVAYLAAIVAVAGIAMVASKKRA